MTFMKEAQLYSLQSHNQQIAEDLALLREKYTLIDQETDELFAQQQKVKNPEFSGLWEGKLAEKLDGNRERMEQHVKSYVADAEEALSAIKQAIARLEDERAANSLSISSLENQIQLEKQSRR